MVLGTSQIILVNISNIYYFQNFFCRVLHRLAEKEILDGTKFTKEKWELLIRKIIENGGDDFSVYSLLRKNYIGKNLEDSLKINIVSMNENEENKNCVVKESNFDGSNTSATTVAATAEIEEDGRANYMADMTIECIPQPLGNKSRTYFKSINMKNFINFYIFFL